MSSSASTRRAAALPVALLALGVCGLASAAPAPDPPLKGKNLVLVTLDTARADFFTALGGPTALTPHIDALAADGAVFLNAYSQTNVTNPSHAVIFTGAYAIDLGILNNRTSFPGAAPGADTIAQAFQRSGYRTGAFPSAPHVSKLRLDLPGFDHGPALRKELRAEDVVTRALRWMARDREAPFFAWLHLFDAHMPYEAPREYRSRFYRGDPARGIMPPLSERPNFERAPPVAKRQFRGVRDPYFPVAMYKAEIRYLDDQIGRLVTQLRQRGLYEKTGIAIIADHGESHGEHDIHYDHAGLYEVSIRIPFFVRVPGFPSGVRVAQRVGQVDLAPTLASLYGLELRGSVPVRGLDLSAALRGEPDDALDTRRVFVHEDAHNRIVMVQRGPWKLIVDITRPWFSKAPISLYHTLDDPGEIANLADRHPEIVSELEPFVQRWVETGAWKRKDTDVDPDELEALEALGYVEDDAADQKGATRAAP